MARNPKISIIDYGVGNLHSLSRAVAQFSGNVEITEDAEQLQKSNAIILPGVGSFEAGMSGLKARGLVRPVEEFVQSGKPVLGICLGAQLMLSKGFEFGEYDGLNLIPGKVTRFPELPEKDKIPHIGWNHIFPHKAVWDGTILANTPENANVYFVHSYILEPDDEKNILAMSEYGRYRFCAAIFAGNIVGCQFHPEKSGPIGLKILENFVRLI